MPNITSVTISNTTTVEGERVNLTCTIRGFPPPNITWYKDGALFPPPHLPPAPSPGVLVTFKPLNSFVVEGQLMFTAVNRSDAGSYTCSAIQRRGGEVVVVNSSAASLSVFCELIGTFCLSFRYSIMHIVITISQLVFPLLILCPRNNKQVVNIKLHTTRIFSNQ